MNDPETAVQEFMLHDAELLALARREAADASAACAAMAGQPGTESYRKAFHAEVKAWDLYSSLRDRLELIYGKLPDFDNSGLL